MTVAPENKILSFPKSKIVREIPQEDSESVAKLKRKGVEKFADAVHADLSGLLLSELANYGFDIESLPFEKDYVFLTSILRALVYRAVDLEHPLHEFMDASVTVKKNAPDTDIEIELDKEDTE